MREINRPRTAESAELVELRVAADRDTVVLAVVGDVCLVSVPLVRAAADAAMDSGARRLVLDLSEVGVLSAAGITLLGRLIRHMHDRDGSVGVRNPRPIARRVLEITGFDHLIESEQRVHSGDHDLGRFGPDADGAIRCPAAAAGGRRGIAAPPRRVRHSSPTAAPSTTEPLRPSLRRPDAYEVNPIMTVAIRSGSSPTTTQR